MMILAAALAAGGALSGLLLIVAGVTARPHDAAAGRPPARWRTLIRTPLGREHRLHLMAAVGTGVAVLGVLGWPVAAVATSAGVYVLPRMLSGRQARQQITRLEALEAWARRLAEVMGASRGLEGALTDSLAVTPAPIRRPVAVLAERLNNRAGTEHALRAFAAELDDPVADLISLSLILSAKRRGPGTRQALALLADAVAQEVRLRREVEAERASLRTTLIVILLAVATVTALFLTSGTLATPYGTPVGQLVMAAVAALYALALGWMRRLATLPTGTRLLYGDAADPALGKGRAS